MTNNNLLEIEFIKAIQNKQVNEILDICNQFITKDNSFIAPLFKRAQIFDLKNDPCAIEDYVRVLEIDPDYQPAKVALKHLHLNLIKQKYLDIEAFLQEDSKIGNLENTFKNLGLLKEFDDLSPTADFSILKVNYLFERELVA